MVPRHKRLHAIGLRRECLRRRSGLPTSVEFRPGLWRRTHDGHPDIVGRKHFGLRGMRERADRINARFSSNSVQPGGTEVIVIVPAATAYAKDGARHWAVTALARIGFLVLAARVCFLSAAVYEAALQAFSSPSSL